MKHIELHIIQALSVSCVNRGEQGTPKSCYFGGVQRDRISSQALKRPIRYGMEDKLNLRNKTWRSRHIAQKIQHSLIILGEKPDVADALARCLSYKLSDEHKTDKNKVQTVTFLSETESDTMAQGLYDLTLDQKNAIKKYIDAHDLKGTEATKDIPKSELDSQSSVSIDENIEENSTTDTTDDEQPIANAVESKGKKSRGKSKSKSRAETTPAVTLDKDTDKAVKKIIDDLKTLPADAVIVAVMGRMMARARNMGIEAASSHSHAISVHPSNIEFDYYSAVDDLTNDTDAEGGAGMLGNIEFNAPTIYRYHSLNIDQLCSQLPQTVTKKSINDIIEAFVEATLEAFPTGRDKTMNSNCLAPYVLITLRDKGHGISYAEAYEEPIRSSNGYMRKAIDRLENHHLCIKKAYKTAGATIFEGVLDVFSMMQEMKTGTAKPANGITNYDSAETLISELLKHV